MIELWKHHSAFEPHLKVGLCKKSHNFQDAGILKGWRGLLALFKIIEVFFSKSKSEPRVLIDHTNQTPNFPPL